MDLFVLGKGPEWVCLLEAPVVGHQADAPEFDNSFFKNILLQDGETLQAWLIKNKWPL